MTPLIDNIQLSLVMEMVKDAPDLLDKMQSLGVPLLPTQIRTRRLADWFDAGEVALSTVDPEEISKYIVYSRKQNKLAVIPEDVAIILL